MSPNALTPNELAVYQRLRAAAEAGAPCPGNRELCALIGSITPTSGPKYLARLTRKGLIRVEGYANGRMVTILRTGRATARPLHTSPHWRQLRAAAVVPAVRHVLDGRAPAPAFGRLKEDYGALADDIRREAFRMRIGLPDFLSGLVLLGWRVHVAAKAEAGASAGMI